MSVAAQKTVTNARHTPSVVAILLTKGVAAKRDLFHPPNQFLPETDKGRKALMPPPNAGTL